MNDKLPAHVRIYNGLSYTTITFLHGTVKYPFSQKSVFKEKNIASYQLKGTK